MNWNDLKVREQFYHSKHWLHIRQYKLCLNPFCEICSTEERPVLAREIHHKLDIQEYPDLRLLLTNLQSLCTSCHSKETYNKHRKTYDNTRDIQILNKKWTDLNLTKT